MLNFFSTGGMRIATSIGCARGKNPEVSVSSGEGWYTGASRGETSILDKGETGCETYGSSIFNAGAKGEIGDGGAAGFTGCDISAGEFGDDCVRGGECGN
jgi:hypothetical protein